MLDAHENLRCGEETIVVPFILGDRERWSKGMLIGTRVTDEVVDAAVSAFISEIIAKHGAPAQRYCNKDPFSAWHYEYLGKLYPNAKFLLVVRDPRAVVHSILSRQLPVSGFITSDIEGCFRVWNSHMEKMIKQCKSVGDRCLLVHYESLVLTPREEMTDILEFLEEPFSEKVLEHEKLIGTDIQLNPLEFSTGQVTQRLYQSALHLWKNYFSESLLRKVRELAPLMEGIRLRAQCTRPGLCAVPQHQAMMISTPIATQPNFSRSRQYKCLV
ncbi:unnamed protein product, partial [Mesorhabditis spiculigera]